MVDKKMIDEALKELDEKLAGYRFRQYIINVLNAYKREEFIHKSELATIDDIAFGVYCADNYLSPKACTRERWEESLSRAKEHDGDCVNQPATCYLCMKEGYYQDAENIIKALKGKKINAT
jgi:hypothetical protein